MNRDNWIEEPLNTMGVFRKTVYENIMKNMSYKGGCYDPSWYIPVCKVIHNIKTKNDALLNFKHPDVYVRYHCKRILEE